jgi:two-component system, cell cycle sensor histidine kinase and response regulator CckA
MMGYYAQLVEQAPDGLVIHDGHRIVDVNAATLRLAGATRREQVIGQLVSSFFERPYLKAVAHALCGISAEFERARFVRERLHGVDGIVRMVDVSAQLFFEQGRPTAHLVLHDAQDRVIAEQLAEERFEQTCWLERAAEARLVAGGIAHQLNNKLQIILGFSGELAESPLADDQRADIAEINRAANECARITRQLLQIASDAPFNERGVQLDTTTLAIVHELERGWPPSLTGVRCHTEDVPTVRIDPGQLRQMLENLLVNARRATDGHGEIDVVVRAVTLLMPQLAADGGRMPAGRYVTVSVRDTGHGMDHGVQRHILQPFFSTDIIGQAAGLGLSAVQGMVRQNGGYLTFSSAVGKGSTFTLWFAEPVRGAGVGRTRPESAAAALSATVVVIDEHSLSRFRMARGLERVGYRVLATRSAEETMEVLSHIGCPALVVMGSDIPVRYPRLRRSLQAQWPQLRVLALASGAGGAASLPLGAPADDSWFTLPAPWSEYALVTRVQELLRESDGPASGQ